MAVEKKTKKPLPKKGPRRGARPANKGASQAETFNSYAFIGTLAGWLLVLAGERIFSGGEGDGFAKFCTTLGVVALLAAFGQRVWAMTSTSADRKPAAQAFTLLNGLSLLALAVYYATTEAGREMFGVETPRTGQPDDFGDITLVVFVALLVLSLLPSVLGELARRSMLRARFVESRRVIAAVVAGVAVSCALTYGTLFTYAAGKVDWHMDFSFFRVAKPSDATVRMLDTLDEPLKVLVFFPTHSEVRQKVELYLSELQQKSAKISFEVHDRLLVPDLAKEHKVRKDGQLVLVRGKMSQTLDIGADAGKAASKLKKLDGEFQKVLLKAMRDKRTVYLTVGHGELNEETDRKSLRTVRLLRQLIESQNYTIKNLGAAQGLGNTVPDDADIVVVLGPTDPFSPQEVEALKRYGEGGGSLLLALDPDAKIDLQPLAEIVGVKWSPGIVVNDKVLYRIKNNDSDKKILVAKRFSSHAAVSTLSKLAARGAAVLVPGAAGLDKLDKSDKSFKVDFAVKSVPGSYVDLNENWTYDKDSEKKATFNLVAAVSKSVVPSEEEDKKKKAKGDAFEMRAMVIGDADVFTDPVMDFAKTNRLLFLEAMRWLGGEESFSGEISEEEDVRIVHTKEQDQAWFYGAIVGVPGSLGGVALFLARRRRRRSNDQRKKALKKHRTNIVAAVHEDDELVAEEEEDEGDEESAPDAASDADEDAETDDDEAADADGASDEEADDDGDDDADDGDDGDGDDGDGDDGDDADADDDNEEQEEEEEDE